MLPDLTNPAGKGFAAAAVLHPDKMCWMLATQGAAHLVSKPLGKVPRACEVVIGCP